VVEEKWSGRILDAINTVPCRSEFDRSMVKEVTKEKVVVLYMSKGCGVEWIGIPPEGSGIKAWLMIFLFKDGHAWYRCFRRLCRSLDISSRGW
jgi:hypothetical protein